MMKDIVKKIKENKKYKSIADDIVSYEVKKYFNEGKREENVVKEIRKIFHFKSISFQTKRKKKIKKYLEELKKDPENFEVIDNLLSVSISTRERLGDYYEVYKRIFNISGKPKIVVDLGGGFNVFSFYYMSLKNVNYLTYDIDEDHAKLINQFFKIMKSRGLKGKADILNMGNLDLVKKLSKSDVVFLFKVLDVIDDKGHKNSEELIELLFERTKFVVVSFATRTLTRRRMNYPQRKWFELMCERKNWKFDRFDFDNEIFYVVR